MGVYKLGSSPFELLRDKMQAPIFSMPNYLDNLVDGTGLNPLLQNYWMVIHPPTLFLGFALTIVPFAFAVTSLFKKEYRSWIKPALPWALAWFCTLEDVQLTFMFSKYTIQVFDNSSSY